MTKETRINTMIVNVKIVLQKTLATFLFVCCCTFSKDNCRIKVRKFNAGQDKTCCNSLAPCMQ